MSEKFKIACVQTEPKPDYETALYEILILSNEAVNEGAKFITLPEYCGGLKTENGLLKPPSSNEDEHLVLNELKKYALTHFQKGFDYMVCGHYHLNEIIDVEKGKLAVLGDWQDDPSYAVFDGKELTLHQWENDA